MLSEIHHGNRHGALLSFSRLWQEARIQPILPQYSRPQLRVSLILRKSSFEYTFENQFYLNGNLLVSQLQHDLV